MVLELLGSNNRVSMEDIKRFANLNTTIKNNSANRLVHHEVNPPQQISCLDIRVPDQSRTGWGPGTYPTNYEVGSVGLRFELNLTFSRQILRRMIFPTGVNADL